MRQIVQLEAARTQEAAAAPPDAAPVSDTAPATDSPAPQPDIVPVYREPGPGEQRTEGILEQIACTRGAVVLHVRTTDRLVRFHAPTLEQIEFITYRTDLSGKVSCGKRPAPDKVIVTWRAGEGDRVKAGDGRAVAVEFPLQ